LRRPNYSQNEKISNRSKNPKKYIHKLWESRFLGA
jgi:hypothetical protein